MPTSPVICWAMHMLTTCSYQIVNKPLPAHPFNAWVFPGKPILLHKAKQNTARPQEPKNRPPAPQKAIIHAAFFTQAKRKHDQGGQTNLLKRALLWVSDLLGSPCNKVFIFTTVFVPIHHVRRSKRQVVTILKFIDPTFDIFCALASQQALGCKHWRTYCILYMAVSKEKF